MKTHAILTAFRRHIFAATIMLVGTALFAAGQQMTLGRTPVGAEISFTRAASGEWGIEIAGGPAPRIAQTQARGHRGLPR